MADRLAGLSVEVDHEIDKLVDRGVAAIRQAIADATRELRETHIPAEAPTGTTGALASDWREEERDPLTRVLTPGLDAWYAHIVARGRSGAQAPRGRALTVAGEFRQHVGPAAGDPFDERAIAALEGRTEELMTAALAGEGL